MANNKPLKIMGFWDLSRSPLTLGGLIILAQELNIQCFLTRIQTADICFLDERVDPSSDSILDLHSQRELLYDPVTKILKGLSWVQYCFLAPSLSKLKAFCKREGYRLWPNLDEEESGANDYGSTQAIQKNFLQYGAMPFFSFKTEQAQWAKNFKKRHAGIRAMVVVHLKHNPKLRGCSNANFSEWFKFFKSMQQRPVLFLFIGNDVIDPAIQNLPNVLLTRNFISDLT